MALALFSYRRGNSFFHRIPGALKLIILFVTSILVFHNGNDNSIEFLSSVKNIVWIFCFFTFAWCCFFLSGKHAGSLKQTGFVFVLGGVMTVFNGIVFYPLSISVSGLLWGLFWTIRFFTVTLMSICVFETTSSLQIKYCFESIENYITRIIPFFKKLHFSLVMSLCINFIPEIFETREKIRTAARARSRKKTGFIMAVRIFSLEFYSLFSIMISKAETKRKAILNRSPHILKKV